MKNGADQGLFFAAFLFFHDNRKQAKRGVDSMIAGPSADLSLKYDLIIIKHFMFISKQYILKISKICGYGTAGRMAET